MGGNLFLLFCVNTDGHVLVCSRAKTRNSRPDSLSSSCRQIVDSSHWIRLSALIVLSFHYTWQMALAPPFSLREEEEADDESQNAIGTQSNSSLFFFFFCRQFHCFSQLKRKANDNPYRCIGKKKKPRKRDWVLLLLDEKRWHFSHPASGETRSASCSIAFTHLRLTMKQVTCFFVVFLLDGLLISGWSHVKEPRRPADEQ